MGANSRQRESKPCWRQWVTTDANGRRQESKHRWRQSCWVVESYVAFNVFLLLLAFIFMFFGRFVAGLGRPGLGSGRFRPKSGRF